MVFRAKRKSMLKVIQATRKSVPQFQGPIFWKLGTGKKISQPNLKKKKNATFINALIGTFKQTWAKPGAALHSLLWFNN